MHRCRAFLPRCGSRNRRIRYRNSINTILFNFARRFRIRRRHNFTMNPWKSTRSEWNPFRRSYRRDYKSMLTKFHGAHPCQCGPRNPIPSGFINSRKQPSIRYVLYNLFALYRFRAVLFRRRNYRTLKSDRPLKSSLRLWSNRHGYRCMRNKVCEAPDSNFH